MDIHFNTRFESVFLDLLCLLVEGYDMKVQYFTDVLMAFRKFKTIDIARTAHRNCKRWSAASV